VKDDDGEVSILRRFTHRSQVDLPTSFESFAAGGTFNQSYTYHTDHLGSVRVITDSVGNIGNSYEYDSFGLSGFTFESVVQPFRYTGREYDMATGLYHYRARVYDPEIGRFLQEDPIGFSAGDMNIYRYVGSNPLSYTDPSGLSQAATYGGTTGVIGGAIAGTISREALRQGGRRLAQELAKPGVGSIARVGGQVACQFFSIAAIIDGGVGSNCGEDGPTEDVESEVVVATGSPGGGPDCEELKQEVRDLKDRTSQFKKCVPGMTEVQLLYRLDAWKALSIARERRDLLCPDSNPNPPGENDRLIGDRSVAQECFSLLRDLRGR